MHWGDEWGGEWGEDGGGSSGGRRAKINDWLRHARLRLSLAALLLIAALR